MLIPCDRSIEQSVPAAAYKWVIVETQHDASPRLLPLSDRVIMDLEGKPGFN